MHLRNEDIEVLVYTSGRTCLGMRLRHYPTDLWVEAHGRSRHELRKQLLEELQTKVSKYNTDKELGGSKNE